MAVVLPYDITFGPTSHKVNQLSPILYSGRDPQTFTTRHQLALGLSSAVAYDTIPGHVFPNLSNVGD